MPAKCSRYTVRNFTTARKLGGSIVGQDCHVTPASVEVDVSVEDASLVMTLAQKLRTTPITSTPNAGKYSPPVFVMSDVVEENGPRILML